MVKKLLINLFVKVLTPESAGKCTGYKLFFNGISNNFQPLYFIDFKKVDWVINISTPISKLSNSNKRTIFVFAKS